MTLHERREAVRAALAEDPCRSDRLIAALTGCNRETVASLRKAADAAPRDQAACQYDQSSGATIASPWAGQGPSRACRKGRDGKTYPFVPRKGRKKSRVEVLRDRLHRLVRDVQDEAVSAEFVAARQGTRDAIGSLSLELASTVARLRRAGSRRAEGRAG
jgi:hypothetical protein